MKSRVQKASVIAVIVFTGVSCGLAICPDGELPPGNSQRVEPAISRQSEPKNVPDVKEDEAKSADPASSANTKAESH